MKKEQTLKYTLLTGWLVTALAIALIAPLIVAEETRSDYFWYRVIWTEILSIIFWAGISFYTIVSSEQNDSVNRFGGIAPAISLVTTVYPLLSFSAMVIQSFLAESDGANRIHWILQIVFLALTVLSFIFFSVSRKAAVTGLAFDQSRARKPKELHDLLALQEASLSDVNSNELRASMKQLREILNYSLNASASLSLLQNYQQLSQEIEALCSSIETLQSGNEENVEQYSSLKQSVKALITKAKLISLEQIKG